MPELHADRQLDPLARRLFDHALLRGSFTLRSGATSDRYFDKYLLACEPRLLGPVAGRLADLVEAAAPDAEQLVAPAVGAVPLATAVALERGLPFAIVRDSSKSYGTERRIEGVRRADAEAVLVEDVVTSGGAALDALEVARADGLRIAHAVCVLDRGGEGRAALAEAGVTLHALLDADDLELAVELGLGREVSA